MKRIAGTIFALAATGMMALPMPGVAQPAKNHETARQIVVEKLGADYTQKQIATFNVIAHSMAASTLCDRLDLDNAAVARLLESVIAESAPTTGDQAAHDALRDRTLIGFGALVGLMLEEATPNNTKFCGAAESDMKKQGAGSLLKPHVAG